MDDSSHAAQHAVEDWDWWHVGRRRVLASVLSGTPGAAGAVGPADVLDVGCGTGGTTAFLASGRRMFGLDLSPVALACSRERGLTRLARGTADRLPFRSGSFDGVFALDVLEHHDDDVAVASEVRRVLRPGGFLLATVPAFRLLWGPHDVHAGHVRRYRGSQLRTTLEAAGLELRRETYFNALLFPPVLLVQLVRWALRLGREPAPRSDLPQRIPRLLNAILREVFALEGRWLRRRRLPVGVSALAIAVRPEGVAG